MMQRISTLYELKQEIAVRSEDMNCVSRKFLEFAIGNPYEIAFGSLTGVASKSGVATNSALKTMRAMGFESYRSFRTMFRDEVQLNSQCKKSEPGL